VHGRVTRQGDDRHRNSSFANPRPAPDEGCNQDSTARSPLFFAMERVAAYLSRLNRPHMELSASTDTTSMTWLHDLAP
jgi:hypothetical protein